MGVNTLGGKNAPLGGHKNSSLVKITSKMNSALSYYSECKFSAKSDDFSQITIIGGILKHFWGQKAPPGVTRIFDT